MARLVAGAQTNRQVADSLYLSVKTVERHLAHIFAKLRVGSRAGVAALVAAAEAKADDPSPAAANLRPGPGHSDHRSQEPLWLQSRTAIQLPVWSAGSIPAPHRSVVAGR